MNKIMERYWAYEILICIEYFVIAGAVCLVSKNYKVGFLVGMVVALGISVLLRKVFLNHHRKSLKLMQYQAFEKAYEEAEKSYNFFDKHPLVDKLRFITMFMSSKVPYRHMALYNMAICSMGLEHYDKMKAIFIQLKEEDCDSLLANNIDTILQRAKDEKII